MVAYTHGARKQNLSLMRATKLPSRWADSNSFCIGNAFPSGYADLLLDTLKYGSVTEAIVALNSGMVDRQNFCLVFSHSKCSYYALWPSDKTQHQVDDFIERLLTATKRIGLEPGRDDKLYLNGVQTSPALETFYASGVSIADTTPDTTPKKVHTITPQRVSPFAKTSTAKVISPSLAFKSPSQAFSDEPTSPPEAKVIAYKKAMSGSFSPSSSNAVPLLSATGDKKSNNAIPFSFKGKWKGESTH
jgi:hypothetical protein